MVDVAHKNLTGTDLHEPKGVSGADADTVYVANGSGSGVWTPVSTGQFEVQYNYYFSNGTWTKPANLIGIEVHAIGGARGGSVSGGTGVSNGTNSSFGGSLLTAAGSTSTAGADGGTSDTSIAGTNGISAVGGTRSGGFARSPYADNGGSGFGKGGDATTTAPSTATSGGGAEYAISWFADSELDASESVVVGQGGDGSTSGGTDGGDGLVVVIEYIQV